MDGGLIHAWCGVAERCVEMLSPQYLEVRQEGYSCLEQFFVGSRICAALSTFADGLIEGGGAEVGLQVCHGVAADNQYMWHRQAALLKMACESEECTVLLQRGAYGTYHGVLGIAQPVVLA